MSEDLIRRSDAIKAMRDTLVAAEIPYAVNALFKVPTVEQKCGEWVLDPNGMDWNIPAWRCSRCGFVANYIGVEANGLGRNPMNWAGSNYCPNCGARMKGADDDSD